MLILNQEIFLRCTKCEGVTYKYIMSMKKLIQLLCLIILLTNVNVYANENNDKYCDTIVDIENKQYPTPKEVINDIYDNFDVTDLSNLSLEERKEIIEYIDEIYDVQSLPMDNTNLDENVVEIDSIEEYIYSIYFFSTKEPVIIDSESSDDIEIVSENDVEINSNKEIKNIITYLSVGIIIILFAVFLYKYKKYN